MDLLPLAFSNITSSITSLLWLVLGAVKVWALVDGARRRSAVYPAAGKQTKALWMVFLGLGLAFHLITLSVVHLVNLAGTVAALVYLVSVRPALDISSGKRRPEGPYGSW